jgi:hypothetical protein
MKLIIAGSRDITEYRIVRDAVICSGCWDEHKAGDKIEVVCGMALFWKWDEDPLIGGVDRLGYEFALRNDLVIHEFKADWKGSGKRAGMVRNAEMGNFADRLIAVWDGKSTGTKQMIDWFRRYKAEPFVYNV